MLPLLPGLFGVFERIPFGVVIRVLEVQRGIVEGWIVLVHQQLLLRFYLRFQIIFRLPPTGLSSEQFRRNLRQLVLVLADVPGPGHGLGSRGGGGGVAAGPGHAAGAGTRGGLAAAARGGPPYGRNLGIGECGTWSMFRLDAIP